VNQTADNTITVRKYNNTYYFFINQELVHKAPFEALPGKYIGFQISSKSLAQINFLSICYINTK